MDGSTFRAFRQRAGWTQVDAAREIGVHTNTVARYERDEIEIPEPVARLLKLLVGGKGARIPERRPARRRNAVERRRH